MEVAMLLHKMALADGIPTNQVGGAGHRTAPPCSQALPLACAHCWRPAAHTAVGEPCPQPATCATCACCPALQLHMPGLSTSASFDDLLQHLMAAEGSLPPSL